MALSDSDASSDGEACPCPVLLDTLDDAAVKAAVPVLLEEPVVSVLPETPAVPVLPGPAVPPAPPNYLPSVSVHVTLQKRPQLSAERARV